ncbi:MAG: hypothetical protein IJ259_03930 [Oscillospiraceae bacterium]|nr:hypothetical protein [Oscillospiraceae bacterium]
MSVDFENEFDYTLESILAEFKSDAYITGQKKTPKSEMDDAVDKIIDEVKTGRSDDNAYERFLQDGQEPAAPETPEAPEDTPLEPEVAAPEVQLHEPEEPEGEESGGDIFDEVFVKSLNMRQEEALREAQREAERLQLRQEDRHAPAPEMPEPTEAQMEFTSDPEDLAERPQQKRRGRNYRKSRRSYEPVNAEGERVDFQGRVSDDDFEDIPLREEDESARYADEDYDVYTRETEQAYEDEEDYEEEGVDAANRIFNVFEDYRHRVVEDEDEILPDPDYAEAKAHFETVFSRYTLRIFFGAFFACVMAFFTFLYEAGLNLPFGMNRDLMSSGAVMLILQLIVMLLGVDVLADGVGGLLHRRPDARTLVAAACFVSALSEIECMVGFPWTAGFPFGAVAAFTLVFAMWGERSYARAYAESIRAVGQMQEPKGVAAGFSENIEKTVLKKYEGYTAGFYNNMLQADISETVYRRWAPLLMIVCLVFSLLLSAVHRSFVLLPHFLSATLTAAAGFSGLLVFSLPYAMAARQLRRLGTGIAGWGGVDDICSIDGARMTDEDLFPPGTVKIEGVKVFKDVQTEKAIRYTASLISESQSGLSRVFEELAKNQQITLVRVEDFTCYEGGIGGSIRGDKVIVGSGAFMALMGIQIPESMNINNAVYTAMNNRLMSVFAVSYKPKNAVRSAIVNILRSGVKLFFAVRDFNITPLMLTQKFKIDLDGIEYMPISETYDISGKIPGESERTCAVLFREGLNAFGEVITCGRRLKSVSVICTVVSVASSLLGILMIFALLFRGTATSVSAGNVLLFLGCMLIIVCMLAGFVKNRR